MKEKDLLKKLKVVKKVLQDGREFYEVFGKTYSSGVIGELLVTQKILETYEKKLYSTDNCSIDFEGNSIKYFDIMLTLDGIKLKINAKATKTSDPDNPNNPKWVNQSAKQFVEYKKNKNGWWCLQR